MPLGTLGKYERLDVLGHGVSGIVYLAKDTLLNRQVALKEVDVQAGDVRRFLEEARVMDRLRHPNIVRVNNVDRIDGKIVIDMEYVRGQNLQDYLRAEGALPVDRAIDAAAQVLDALNYAHAMQTVHRDIKPANILIGRDGSVKLVDFGLAEILATNAYAGGAGTYAYMAPEDFADEDRSDSQSDIWAVGVTLFEMVTVHRPFSVLRVKDPFAWKRVVERDPPLRLAEFLPSAPAALQAALDRALALSKSARYATAGEFRDDLRRVLTGDPLPESTLQAARTMAARRAQAPQPADAPARESTASPYDEATAAPTRHSRSGEPADKTALPGTVVAEVTAPQAPTGGQSGRRRFGLLPAKAPARLVVHPNAVEIGQVRKGDIRSAVLNTQVVGGGRRVRGRITRMPDWLTAHPMAFEHARQKIVVTAHSDRVWETGQFEDALRIETEAGAVDVRVQLTVIRPRAAFSEIALWFVPLFAAVLLPVVAAASGRTLHGMAVNPAAVIPVGAAVSGMLALMLLLVGVAADIGPLERAACGLILAVMCFVLGIHAAVGGHTGPGATRPGMHYAELTGGALALVLLFQVFYFSRWRLWAVVVFCISIASCAGFLGILR